MECYNCGARLSDSDFCNACGVDVKTYKKIVYTSNRCYNEGLAKAKVRDLSGAVISLRQCLKFNKNHVDARNLLGLIYFEAGEAISGLVEWIISKNIKPDKNIADDYLNMIQQNQGRLEVIKNTIHKYNKALDLCYQDSPDLAIITLKKVLSTNPKYVQAHLLLALLYINQENWGKAKKELDRVAKVDCGNLTEKRYRAEIDAILRPAEEKSNMKKIQKNDTITYKNGNETIIQPVNDKDSSIVRIFIQVAIGIVIGLCFTYYVILPRRLETEKSELESQVVTYSAELDKKNTEIDDLNTRISSLEQSNLDLQESLQQYVGTNGVMEANNYLLAAAYSYMDNSQDNMEVDKYLDLISQEYLDNEASTEFLSLYGTLKNGIGDTVSDSYYTSGLDAYNQMDYTKAIADLEKAYLYDSESDDALYYLALSYFDSGDVTHAKDYFNELISKFPNSSLVDKANQRLEEIGE